jgi:hypothetical protein
VVITIDGFTTTLVAPGRLVHPLSVTVILYVPLAAAVAFAIDGF